jgi:uncharacterized membrane protein
MKNRSHGIITVIVVAMAFLILELVAYFRFTKIGLPEVLLFGFIAIVATVLVWKLWKTRD